MIADQVHEFSRGASFEAIMSLPVSIPENYFADWQPFCQLRKVGSITESGYIGELALTWTGPREFLLSSDETDKWPLGKAELDILFTSPQGRRIRTKKLVIDIKHGTSID